MVQTMEILCFSLWKPPRIANTVQGLSQQQVQQEFLGGLSHSLGSFRNHRDDQLLSAGSEG